MNIHLRLLTPLVLAGLANAQVVINEVYYDAPGDDNAQVFVELFGPANTDISGWTIRGIEGSGAAAGGCNANVFTFPNGTLIPADGFVVIADGDASGVTLVANADFIVANMDLENGPDAVQLLDIQNGIVDAVAYGAVDTSVLLSSCTGQPWFEGNPARDVFAPLSIERVPAGGDTGDNDADFAPSTPTPGTGRTCSNGSERIGSAAISASGMATIGLDFWLQPCGANRDYLVLIALTDPAQVPPPLGLPVFDDSSFLWVDVATAPGPFRNFFGVLDTRGRAVGRATIDFQGTGVTVPIGFDIWLGAVAYDLQLNIDATTAQRITINP